MLQQTRHTPTAHREPRPLPLLLLDPTTPSASPSRATRNQSQPSSSALTANGSSRQVRLPLSLPLSHPSLNLARAVPPHPPHPTTSLPSLPPSSAAEPTIHLHSLPSFSLHRTFSSHTGGVSDVAFSADSTLLASASDDTTVRVWEVDPALPLAHRPQHPDETPDSTTKVEHAARVLQGHLTAVFCVAWSPRGDLVASGGVDETVRVWDVQKGALRSLFLLLLRSELTETGPTGRCMRVLPAHSEPVSAVQFSRDGTMLVSCSWDGYMCVSPSPLASPSRPPLTPGSPPLLRPQPHLGHVDGPVPQDARARGQHARRELSLQPKLQVPLHGDARLEHPPVGLPERQGRQVVRRARQPQVRPPPLSFSVRGITEALPTREGTELDDPLPRDRYCTPPVLTPDGRHLVAGSEDHKVVVWDVQTREVVAAWVAHKGASQLSSSSLLLSPSQRGLRGNARARSSAWLHRFKSRTLLTLDPFLPCHVQTSSWQSRTTRPSASSPPAPLRRCFRPFIPLSASESGADALHPHPHARRTPSSRSGPLRPPRSRRSLRGRRAGMARRRRMGEREGKEEEEEERASQCSSSGEEARHGFLSLMLGRVGPGRCRSRARESTPH